MNKLVYIDTIFPRWATCGDTKMSVEWEKYQKGRNNKKEGNELFGKESFF